MHVRMRAITKRFGSTLAVDGVDFEAPAGQVTALLGENGAGKSTLMKLLYGMHRPDAGSIELGGTVAAIGSPRSAMALGIGMVFQQFSLIGSLSVRENLALMLPGLPWWIGRGAKRLRAIDQHLRKVVPEIDPDQLVCTLPVGSMQLVELAKVLLLDARCVIFDEPSAVLTPPEALRLWDVMRGFAGRGLSVVLITHKLHDVQSCADRVSVMRAGRMAATLPAQGLDDAGVVELMVGRAPPPAQPRATLPASARTRLWIKGLSAGAAQAIDLRLRAGEIVGIAGVSGNGQAALAEAVAGMLPLEAGEVILDGELLRAPRLRARLNAGVGYIPERPLANAVAPELSVGVILAFRRIASLPFVPRAADLDEAAAALIARFGIRPADPRAQAQWLSGGNLQKLVVARELAGTPAVVVACYPTMGLDVTASAQVHEALFGLARQGSAVLWICEDLDDLMRHAHRIAVMLQGRIVGVVDAADATLPLLGRWMAGASGDDAAIETAEVAA